MNRDQLGPLIALKDRLPGKKIKTDEFYGLANLGLLDGRFA